MIYREYTECYSISFLFLFFFHQSSLYPIKIFANDSTESFGPCALKVNTVLVSKLFLLCTVAHGTHVPVAWFTPIYGTRLRV